MTETGVQSLGSGHSNGTQRHPSIIEPILSKRVCFYKSGDPQFNGLRMVINNRTFKTFDALLDSLSKKVPLPFGVRNITTPRGFHAISTLNELEDGKSYICSDSRKVRPINMALARKKLPPWDRAKPASSRRKTVQQARIFTGQVIHKKERVVVRTPKRLLVFRNGVPTVKHTVLIHKRTTPTFESILEYISDVIQFHVVKLHTPDGRRVDSLPGLILCSGIVVAAGREPFKPANYNAEISPAPVKMPTNRIGLRRVKALNRKKKSLSYTSMSRKFSPSSERYIVNRIHDSIAESDLPSYPTNSFELESGRVLESVAETESDTCLGDGTGVQDYLPPAEDDIEKSFRVNQDGSMTVEMRVRLTIKEEETVHWTTTLSRSSVTSQLNGTCLPESEVEQEISSLKSNLFDLESPTASIDTIEMEKSEDNNDEEPQSLGNRALSHSSKEEENIKAQTAVVSPRRTPTPAHKQIIRQQASVESMQSVTPEGFQEGMIGSYSYRKRTEQGAMIEQYCMVKQSSTKPVPKPRRFESMDATNMNSSDISTFNAAGLTEVLQIDLCGKDVSESVLSIYEQQTCQDNFPANVCAHGLPACGIPLCRPATSETGQLSSTNEFETPFWRPSTASEPVSFWRAESTSVASDLKFASINTGALQVTNIKQRDKDKPQQREVKTDKNASWKPKVINKPVRRPFSSGKRKKENSAQVTKKRKKAKTFSSAGFIKKIYGNISKSAKSTKKLKKGPAPNGNGGVTVKSSQKQNDTIHPDLQSSMKQRPGEANLLEKSIQNGVPDKAHRPWQTSVQQEKKNKKKPYDISESMPLPAVNSSSSVTLEYVENWLEKSHLDHTAHPNEDSKTAGDGLWGESENKRGLMIVAEDTRQTQETELLPEDLRAASIKDRIQSFESKLSPSMGKIKVNQQTPHGRATMTNIENNESLAQNNVGEIKPLPNHCCCEINSATEIPPQSENKSSQIKTNTLSMELPPPPTPAEIIELSNPEHFPMDVSSMVSGPVYPLSSVSSQTSGNHPSSNIPTEKSISPTDHTVEMPTSIHTDMPSMQGEAPLLRTSSIKRSPLVSNQSLDRKMSLRKARLDKYTLCSDAPSEETTLYSPINTAGDKKLQEIICSTRTQQQAETPPDINSLVDLKSSPSCGSSVYPASLTSEERTSPATVSSSEAPTPNGLPFKETNVQKEASSPKPFVEKVKLNKSQPKEREPQTKKVSTERSHNPSRLSPPDIAWSPNIGRKHAATESSPATERKHSSKLKLQNRSSPYSQSLDLVSPTVRRKSGRKLLSWNLSSDSASEPITPSERKQRQSPPSIKSAAELDKTPTGKTQGDQSNDINPDRSMAETQIMPQPLMTADQPDMKPLLEDICSSIRSIRKMTQSKRPSFLERPSSVPDFSSLLTSTFGSSSKALLAFLSVMTLKEHTTTLNTVELNADNVSCTEALKMIESLREIAAIEDSDNLKVRFSDLQQLASKQLLQSWTGFQELCDKCRRGSLTPNDPEQDLESMTCSGKDCGTDENVIDEIVDLLDIPEMLKMELASLSVGVKGDSDPKMSHHSREDSLHTRNCIQEKTTSVMVSAMIKKSPDQPEQTSTGSIREIAKQPSQDKDSRFGKNGETKSPTTIPDEHLHEEKLLYNKGLVEEESGEDTQSSMDRVKGENKGEQKQGHEKDNLSSEQASIEGMVSCTSEVEEEDMEGDQLQTPSEESVSMLENRHAHEGEPSSRREGNNTSSTDEDLELSSSDASRQHSSEEELEVEFEAIKQASRGGKQSSEEEDKKPGYCIELNARGKRITASPECKYEYLLEEEEPEDVSIEPINDALSNPANPKNPENEQESRSSCIEPNVSTRYSAVDDTPSEEELPEVECKELKVIVEESVSGIEDEQQSMEEEESLPDPPHEVKEEMDEKVSLEDEDHNADGRQICDTKQSQSIVGGNRSVLVENHVSFNNKKSDNLAKCYRFSADSGNDHSSFEEQEELEQPKVVEEPICSSAEELSYHGKESSSEEERVHVDRYIEGSCTKHHEASSLTKQMDGKKCEKAVEEIKHPSKDKISQSIAARVNLLEKRVADAQNRKNTTVRSPMRRFSQRPVPLDSDGEESLPTSESALGSRSAPQSSLSFSYDSAGGITTEPEGNRVKSIMEMFLAKSATDIQNGHRCCPNPNAIEMCELRADTSVSGGYQSQTSSDLSSGEDDSAQKSITKGFVRKTIERLYGKKHTNPDEDASRRPPSVPKQKKTEHSSIFSPFHIARSKALSELSYFNSANALDSEGEATRCVAFNAQVGPGDSVPIDNGRWLLKENALMRKSVSDPAGINKAFAYSPRGEGICVDTEEDSPHSLLSTKSEQEGRSRSPSKKCIYFSLPNGSDSDVLQDDLTAVSKSSMNGDTATETEDHPEDTKTRAERNGKLPKIMDNKVHPLMELPPEGEVVVAQPGRGQGALNRRLPEPDMLDILYDFCGQNCPIL